MQHLQPEVSSCLPPAYLLYDLVKLDILVMKFAA